MQMDFKDKGTEYAKKAVEEDGKQNYEAAVQNYLRACEYFQLVIKYEKNEKLKESYETKIREYVERAEFLKKNISGATQGSGQGGTSATGQLAKGNNNQAEEDKSKLTGQIASAIQTEKPNVKWEDVAGLEHAKEALKEAVIIPVKFPHFFEGKRKPWSGILMYGPPGTGKSYLAKAVATEADSTFFSISSADLVSKWMGESEKLVASLFKMAKENTPSIVFIDEIDSICSARGDNESEAARRIKTQFMVEMNDIRDGNNSQARVLMLGATNLPYELDQAVRRRFDKRIYIPLPEAHARSVMFKIHLGATPHNLKESDFVKLGQTTEGFSGSDINVLVRDVIMEPLRKIQEATHFVQVQTPEGAKWLPCAPRTPGAVEHDLDWFAEQGQADNVQLPSLTMDDFVKVQQRARPTVSQDDLKVFENFTAEFGEEGT